MEFLFWVLNYVRENLLEEFEIPGLEISYWDFCIILAMIAVVITVLIVSVKVSGGSAVSHSKNSKAEKNSYSTYKANRERSEAYDNRYRAEHGQKARRR